MSDFLVNFDPAVDPQALLSLVRQLYDGNVPPGRCLSYPWGTAAILDEKIGTCSNVISRGQWTFAWVGELLFSEVRTQVNEALNGLNRRGLCSSPEEAFDLLNRAGLLAALNGSFAALISGPGLVAILTDPMGGVQVYAGKDGVGRLAAVGTHPDLVARLCGPDWVIDPVSVGDFLNTGTPCCPHTMHQNVREIWPGTVAVSLFPEHLPELHAEFRYWLPPGEVTGHSEEQELTNEFVERWQRAVVARCEGKRVAVQLSGGMDSRLVLASIPPGKQCIAVTLCDSMNREARFARRVAECYGREWVPLARDAEYLGRTLVEATRFTGCEGEYHHGHTIGFVRQLRDLGVDAVFTGLLMDNNFKGYYAKDYVRVSRLKGLLPARHVPVPLDYVNQVSDFCRRHLQSGCVEGILERRRVFEQNHFARGRESRWEWLDGYPYSQSCDNTGWVIERRVMPVRLPVMDRALLDLAFKVPMRLKAGGHFFEQAAVRILGPGRNIPSANDGVRPGSRHVSRLVQRAVRKTQRAARTTLSSLGFKLPVPHSWHDFPGYLHESSALGELIARHGHWLRDFEAMAFKGDPTKLLRNQDVPWPVGYRLIQLAVWRSILGGYHQLQRQPLDCVRC